MIIKTQYFLNNFYIEAIRKTAQSQKDRGETYDLSSSTFITIMRQELPDISQDDLDRGVSYIKEIYGVGSN